MTESVGQKQPAWIEYLEIDLAGLPFEERQQVGSARRAAMHHHEARPATKFQIKQPTFPRVQHSSL